LRRMQVQDEEIPAFLLRSTARPTESIWKALTLKPCGQPKINAEKQEASKRPTSIRIRTCTAAHGRNNTTVGGGRRICLQLYRYCTYLLVHVCPMQDSVLAVSGVCDGRAAPASPPRRPWLTGRPAGPPLGCSHQQQEVYLGCARTMNVPPWSLQLLPSLPRAFLSSAANQPHSAHGGA
jgi:hypothetical protein